MAARVEPGPGKAARAPNHLAVFLALRPQTFCLFGLGFFETGYPVSLGVLELLYEPGWSQTQICLLLSRRGPPPPGDIWLFLLLMEDRKE